ncbi:N-acetylmuramoyl-L-alanine amidase [Alcaligenes endophyticus]|uniref:N-acetylmuramoyl-L-alanine amidase n=1 Tax=Alcaligenes endophyticus TaxID=1929088 RepID=A0ABT8EHQ3_9BURK|nr:N-acetylmuramoyl-L-alanine amidase [Alcaligenes endophyticus]MCX5592164.1 N-acetylmuramoyl-L-alanine amidase [Alcaligenes endophyticus]MDN4120811.1 N-acetylmuramoyl-L-alanine amidase [Alcaligenes endophyticus]
MWFSHIETMRPLWRGVGLAACLLAAACSQTTPRLQILDTHEAVAQSSRVRYIVIHYTASPYPRALRTLTGDKVSAHYLITDHSPPLVYRLVDENRRAWHAGASSWYGNTDINTGSIGIEIVNRGPIGPGQWDPYSQQQIEVSRQLLQTLTAKHGVLPQNIIGHSDIAPQRKVDPGPLFPWAILADAGLGRWYDEEMAQSLKAHYKNEPLPSASTIQQLLAQAGYEVTNSGQFDSATQNVIRAFQMHYRPALYDGVMDAETFAILLSLR